MNEHELCVLCGNPTKLEVKEGRPPVRHAACHVDFMKRLGKRSGVSA